MKKSKKKSHNSFKKAKRSYNFIPRDLFRDANSLIDERYRNMTFYNDPVRWKDNIFTQSEVLGATRFAFQSNRIIGGACYNILDVHSSMLYYNNQQRVTFSPLIGYQFMVEEGKKNCYEKKRSVQCSGYGCYFPGIDPATGTSSGIALKLEYIPARTLSTLITKFINVQKYLNHTGLISKWYGLFWTSAPLPYDARRFMPSRGGPNNILIGMIIEDIAARPGWDSAAKILGLGEDKIGGIIPRYGYGPQYAQARETLIRLFERLHGLGWAHGDAHFKNIMISPDGRDARLIDLPSILPTKSKMADGRSIDSTAGSGKTIFDIPGWNLELAAKIQPYYDERGNPYNLFVHDPRDPERLSIRPDLSNIYWSYAEAFRKLYRNRPNEADIVYNNPYKIVPGRPPRNYAAQALAGSMPETGHFRSNPAVGDNAPVGEFLKNNGRTLPRKDLKEKLGSYNNYKTDMIIDYEMSKARYLQAIARSPRLTIGMTLPLIEELLGEPHEIITSKATNQKEQLWVYFLKDKKLELSFKDFILFKIEEI